MPLAPEQTLTTQHSTVLGGGGSNPDVTRLVTTADIPAGRVLTIAVNRGASSTSTNGIASVATSAGALGTLVRLADACRVSVQDLTLLAVPVTTLIPSGSTITLTHRTTSAGRRGAVLTVWPASVTSPPVVDASSGVTADNQLGDTSRGPNGSASPMSATTTATTTAGPRLLLAAFSVGGTQAFAQEAGWTKAGEARTATGSSDRGVALVYRVDDTPSVETATATLDPSGSWAAGIAALPGTFTTSPPSLTVSESEHVQVAATTNRGGLAIAQTSGPTAAPVALEAGVWLLPRHATDTRVYRVTATDDGYTAAQNITVAPADGSGAVAGGPRRWDGTAWTRT